MRMDRGPATRIGPWAFSRFRLAVTITALAVLALECVLLVRNSALGLPWERIWPLGLSALALVVVLVQSLRKARVRAADERGTS